MNTLQATSVRMKILQTTTLDGMNTLKGTLDDMNTLQATLDSILRHQRFIYPRYQRSWYVLLGGIICFIKTLSPPFFKRPIWITNFPCDIQINVQTNNMSNGNYYIDKTS